MHDLIVGIATAKYPIPHVYPFLSLAPITVLSAGDHPVQSTF